MGETDKLVYSVNEAAELRASGGRSPTVSSDRASCGR